MTTHFNIVERGTGRAIVLLHGFAADHRVLTSLDDVLAQGGWRRVYVDLPGFGATPIGECASTDDVVAAVVGMLRERFGDEEFALLGHSYGAMVARAVAHEMRDDVLGLALLVPAFVADSDAREVPQETVLHHDDAALRAAGDDADDYAQIAVVQSVDGAKAFVEHNAPGAKIADEEAMSRLTDHYELGAQPEDGEAFTRPSVIVTGRQDHVVGYHDSWARIEHYPRATFAVLDEAGHNAHLDAAPLVEALVGDWLRRMTPFEQR